MVDALGALGAVDHLAVGLEGFGRPDGVWNGKWNDGARISTATQSAGYPGPGLGVDRWLWLEDTGLDANRVESSMATFTSPTCLSRRRPLAAIVDWELATIGDPLLDLGLLLDDLARPGERAEPGRIHPRARRRRIHDRDRDGRTVRARAPAGTSPISRGTGSSRGTASASSSREHACAPWPGRHPPEVGDMLHQTTVNLLEQAHRTTESV